MKKLLMTLSLGAVAAGCCRHCTSDTPAVTAVSPDGRNEIRLWTDPLAYAVARDGAVVVAKSAIGLTVDGRDLAREAAAKRPAVSRRTQAGSEPAPVYKKASLDLAGAFAKADFGDWGVELAARDDGVAYRFYTAKPGTVTVDAENASLTVPCPQARCALNYGCAYGCEETVPVSCAAGEIETGKAEARAYVYLPFVYRAGKAHVAVTESDVWDYPVWNLTRVAGTEGVAFASDFAKWPVREAHAANAKGWDKVEELPSGGRWVRVKETADALVVQTPGTRTYPWRTFVLADAPAKFCEADIVNALARPAARGADFSWVRPGKVAWDWWNAWDNRGEAAGCTTAGYRRFIDFAAKTGVEYVILDEGWSETLNIWKFHPNVDVPEIIRYGSEKGVGIILWMAWAQIYGEEEKVAAHFAKLGAKGFKVDFMDRGDAACERFLWRFAEACAKNRMLVDYHGAHRPTGMSRAYPNVLNYEGIHGLEQMKWFKNGYDFMDNDVKAFFLRMTAGPMDYTPGAMDNSPIGRYRGDNVNPGSVGTRCRQMAMMVLYEAPLQMLCDAPTKYERNMESFAFMAATPVVWARTVGLGGCPDTYAACARQAKDGSWHAAAISNGDARDIALDTAFLGAGEWNAELFRDADDADVRPTRYVHETKTVRAGETLNVRMAPGGGFVVKFVRK